MIPPPRAVPGSRPNTRSTSSSSTTTAPAAPTASPAVPAAPAASASTSTSNSLAVPAGPSRTGTSPMSYSAMTGISFANGGGFSFDKGTGATPKSVKWGKGVGIGRSNGDMHMLESPQFLSTSVTMEPSSFANSAAFNLPSSLSSSYRRSYAAAARGDPSPNPNALSSSFASMSMGMSFGHQPMSFGTSYSKSQVHSLMNARSDAELTQTYECCGATHEGLHALLEHVEDVHPFSDPADVNVNPFNHNLPIGFSPQVMGMNMEMELEDLNPLDDKIEQVPSQGGSSRGSLSPPAVVLPSYPLPGVAGAVTGTSPLPLSISELLKSPPEEDSYMSNFGTRTASTCSSPPEGSLATPTTSTAPSPVFAAPKLTPRGPQSSFWGSGGPPRELSAKRFDRAFNEVVAGALKPSIPPKTPTAVAPNVLFASSSSTLTPTKPTGEVDPDKTPAPAPAAAALATAAEPALPAPSLFTTHKPWRCPNPGCNKAYRQSNGLKYHQQKGQCDFGGLDLTELGLSAEEAELKSRPYVCAVGAGCTKRYRQMNGLKYHYLNSGEHGQYGLRMIQNGTHPNPVTPGSSQSGTPRSNLTSTAPRPSTAPYTIPSKPLPNSTSPLARPPTTAAPSAAPAPAGVAARPITGIKTTPVPRPTPLGLPPIQRGRDAVLFSTVGLDS